MYQSTIRVYKSKELLEKESQLAWRLAKLATDTVPVEKTLVEAVIDKVIDNTGVAMAAINRGPVVSARAQALAHPRPDGAALFGLPAERLFAAEWAAWANAAAIRELDMHDTFLAEEYAHPADNIPHLVAVAQQCNCSGEQLIQAILTGYEVQIDLCKSISLHKHKIDHIAHLGPSVAAGIGTLLGLDIDIVYQAIQQALHVTCTTRQSRKGQISSWKAYAPAHAGKLAIEAVDRAMRGETSPSPIYEGEDSVIAYMLDGPGAEYVISLPEEGEPKRAILESYTKEHSAEYQSQALIDLAFRMRRKIKSFSDVEKIIIHTSHHTHNVIGTGAADPQKMDPKATRETLDHSIMYIFAVALQDGEWHHVNSYLPTRANRADTVKLWHTISTREDHSWTEKYHHPDPQKRCFGARVEIKFNDGSVFSDEINVANAHPSGDIPFGRDQYIRKYRKLTEDIVENGENERFLQAAQSLSELKTGELSQLNITLPEDRIIQTKKDNRGIF